MAEPAERRGKLLSEKSRNSGTNFNETTGISNSLTGEQNVYIFVDPSTKNVQIRNIAKGTTAVVYGLDGMKIFQDQVSETGYLDTDRLIPGIYLLKIDHHVFKFRRP